MIAIQKFDMHLDRPGQKLRICGVQGDALSRAVCFLMHQNNRDWFIPEDIQVAVWYVKSDRTGGMYDALPDGSPAWQAAGSALTVYLAPQMFTAAGEVQVQLELRSAEAVLHSFAFSLEVSGSLPLAEGSQDYFCWKYAFLPQTVGGEAGQVLQITAVDTQGRVTQVSGVEMQNLGENGATFYPAVSQTGDLSWTNDRGLENPETVNLMGPAGYSPVRGTDYWTEEDKAEIKAYVDEMAGSGSSVQADFAQNDSTQPDYVKNRTHWEENNQTVIEWDGSTEGRDTITMPDGETVYYKASELTPTAQDVIGGTMSVNGQSVFITEDMIEDLGGSFAIIESDVAVFLVALQTSITIYGNTISVPSTGCYTRMQIDGISLTYSSTTVHQLEEKFIPDTIARKADVTWENLPDKPFYDNQTVAEWDGEWENVTYTEPVRRYRALDEAPEIGELIGATVVVEDTLEQTIFTLDSTNIQTFNGGYLLSTPSGDVFAEGYFVDYPDWEKGLYLVPIKWRDVDQLILSYVSKLTYGSAKTLDEKFIPDTIARKSDIPASVTDDHINALIDAKLGVIENGTY